MRRSGLRYLVVFFPAAAIAYAGLWAGAEAPPAGGEYLSDRFAELVTASRQDWGRIGLDTAACPTDGRAPSPIRLAGTVHPKGIGHHAEIVLLDMRSYLNS